MIDYLKFRTFLRDINVIPFGEDIEEEFQTFLALSSSREDLIMLRKLK